MVARSARRREQIELAGSLRAHGGTWTAIAAALRGNYGLNGRVAMRLAHGWGQAEAAAAWNARWPDEPKSFKNFSYWENWPSPTGHMPSLAVLDRLAELYECDVADILTGWGEHRPANERHDDSGVVDTEPETFAWQVGNLHLHELTRALADWSRRLPAAQRRTMLLKLSTAAAVASAAGDAAISRRHSPMNVGLQALEGSWTSTYRYYSTGCDAELEGVHTVILQADDRHLVGHSVPQPSGSELELMLLVDGSLATGTWTERTSPNGHYRAATYHGLLQLVVDPTGRSMNGAWLGVSKRFNVKSGDWRLDWNGPQIALE